MLVSLVATPMLALWEPRQNGDQVHTVQQFNRKPGLRLNKGPTEEKIKTRKEKVHFVCIVI